jgi:acyl-CoA thioesterase
MSEPFFDLKPTHNPYRWYLPIDPSVCVGPPTKCFMFGGVGLASAIRAMEQTCDRPVVWATAQYLSYARPPSIVDLDVRVPAHGKSISQARVIGHVGDKEIFTVNAALGRRDRDISHTWVKAPEVAPPEDCPHIQQWLDQDKMLHGRLETRVAYGRYGADRKIGGVSEDGRVVLWIRPTPGIAIDPAMLAIIADFVPSGIGSALGRAAGGNSLDNTIRYCQFVPTEWVLCDIRIQAIHGGFGQGSLTLFAQTGQLLATASQSLILRIHDDHE